ncbi:MAG TPA: zinc ribbon domain-containing protein [Ruminococcus sp.]|nr:zinc ribbon domain-containing protein [Ruminococcus sp.]HBN11080.1 zinc ribbon domain-containing protein [Ruminococcus sp.]HCR73740.1 zinc ribbon domain-containing protein [Ruminococcus sp.]
MGIVDKFNDVSRTASEKAKNMSELSNLKRKIMYEEERIGEIFAEMGKTYYKNPKGDVSVLNNFCKDIDDRRRRIRKMRFEVNDMRGYKQCPKCNAEVNVKFQFCGVCGARIPNPDDNDFSDDMDFFTSTNADFFKDEQK